MLDVIMLFHFFIVLVIYITFINYLFSAMPITKIHARQIYDSRGNPTVEVDLYTEKGKT